MSHLTNVTKCLLEFYELLEASTKILPHLKHVDLNLNMQSIDADCIRIKSNYQDGILSANLKEAETMMPPSDYDNHPW